MSNNANEQFDDNDENPGDDGFFDVQSEASDTADGSPSFRGATVGSSSNSENPEFTKEQFNKYTRLADDVAKQWQKFSGQSNAASGGGYHENWLMRMVASLGNIMELVPTFRDARELTQELERMKNNFDTVTSGEKEIKKLEEQMNQPNVNEEQQDHFRQQIQQLRNNMESAVRDFHRQQAEWQELRKRQGSLVGNLKKFSGLRTSLQNNSQMPEANVPGWKFNDLLKPFIRNNNNNRVEDEGNTPPRLGP